jgi:hypothetical protein
VRVRPRLADRTTFIDHKGLSTLVIDDTTISCYRGGMTTRQAAATAARVRIGLETMAAKLVAAGYDVKPPPECPHGCSGFLHWVDDQWICMICGDEWGRDQMEERRVWQ